MNTWKYGQLPLVVHHLVYSQETDYVLKKIIPAVTHIIALKESH